MARKKRVSYSSPMTTICLVLALQGADELKAHFAEIQKAIRETDLKAVAEKSRALLCDEARLKKALKEDVDKDVLAKLVDMQKGFGAAPDEKIAVAFKGKPEQTEIQVHGAKTEDIAAYAKDSVAFKEFPGGAKDLAASVLRPGLTFYEVEFLEPGKDAGMKYHLFFHDGERWAMLGPAWRALKK
jgi:hypothetical protein